MNTLVTDAAGYIGSHAVKRLVADGHHVVAVDIELLEEDGGWAPT